jgi:hypothetical protein
VNKRRPRGRAGKKQKNFIRLVPALSTTQRRVTKVFLLLFFQKKKTLPACRLLLGDAGLVECASLSTRRGGGASGDVTMRKIRFRGKKRLTSRSLLTNYITMNTSPASNPFTGLKGALAGLMSGGWMGLLLGLLFRRRIAPMLAALEALFAQFKAGTLPIPAAPGQAPAAARPAAPRAHHCPRHRTAAARRRPVARPAALGARPAALCARPAVTLPVAHGAYPRPAGLSPLAAAASSRFARCRKKFRRGGALAHVQIVTISK